MTLLIFLIVLSILIFVHEFGHFIVAKKSGIKVEEFGMGFPPKLWSKKIGETLYSINLFPVGGFVKLYGENNPEGQESEKTFYAKSKLVRTGVTSAGVGMNFLLAVVAFSAITWFIGVPQETGRINIIEIAPNSPAAEAGLEKEDVVLTVNGKSLTKTEDFINLINNKKGEEINLTIQKPNNLTTQVSLTPRENPPEGEGALGVIVSSAKLVQPPLWQKPFISVSQGTQEAVFWVKNIVVGVSGAIYQAIRGNPPKDLAGPVGIFQITGGVAKAGPLALTSFLGILSINLAVLNVLPFPALDGGRLLFIIIETITGRRVKPKVEHIVHTAGMAVLLLLLLLITMRDINRIFQGFSFFPSHQ